MISSFVLVDVMKTTDDNDFRFEGKSSYQEYGYFSDKKKEARKFENDRFIVPWQMEKTQEKQFLVGR